MNTISRIFLVFLLVLGQVPLAAMPPKYAARVQEHAVMVRVAENNPARIAYVRGTDALENKEYDEGLKLFRISHSFCVSTKDADADIKRMQYSCEYNIGLLLYLSGDTKNLPFVAQWLEKCLEHIEYNPQDYYCSRAMFFLAKALWESGVEIIPRSEPTLRKILYLADTALGIVGDDDPERIELEQLSHKVRGALGRLLSGLYPISQNRPKLLEAKVIIEKVIQEMDAQERLLYATALAGSVQNMPVLTDGHDLTSPLPSMSEGFSRTIAADIQTHMQLFVKYKMALLNCLMKLGGLSHQQARATRAIYPRR